MTKASQEWTLQGRGIIVHRGDLVEYEDASQQLLSAMVVAVDVVALSSSQYRAGDQVVAVRRITSSRRPKPSDLANHNIAATQVVRLHDPAQPLPRPSPAPKTLFAPNADDNPWRTVTWMTAEEWKQVSRWYSYSLRGLLDDGDWYEHGRYRSRDSAYAVMRLLAKERPSRCLVIIYCTDAWGKRAESGLWCPCRWASLSWYGSDNAGSRQRRSLAMGWDDLNERQRQYMLIIFETDQLQEQAERMRAARTQRSRPADQWRWMGYADTYAGHTRFKQRLVDAGLVDEGTGSTFEALRKRGLIEVGGYEEFGIRLTAKGRVLVRRAKGLQAPQALPTGTLREWHWKALALAWQSRPAGVLDISGSYGHIGWNTWLRLRDYRVRGEERPLVEEYHTTGEYNPTVGYSSQIHWIKLTPYGEQYYQENWQRYHEMYPSVDAADPALMIE